MKTINEALISAIHNQNEKELIPVLMTLLNLGKQSVYRRLRGEIPFTLEEASILSLNMGFSIDNIINQKNIDNNAISTGLSDEADLQDTYIGSINKFSRLLEKTRKSKNSALFSVSNQLLYDCPIFFENLTKMKYFRWTHQRFNISDDLNFSDFLLPAPVTSAIKNLIYNYVSIETHTIILDQSLLRTTITEINYFYERNLISVSDLELLQNELLQIIDELEILAIKGHYKSGSKVNIYLSSLSLENNCILLEDVDGICFQTELNTEESLFIFNPRLCYNQKKWINSLKKYSTLISESNEFSRSRFFKKQRDAIKNLKKYEKLLYI